jgi:hypothetical protein
MPFKIPAFAGMSTSPGSDIPYRPLVPPDFAVSGRLFVPFEDRHPA